MALRALKGPLLDNWALKVVSLLIAVALWVRVVGSEQSEGRFRVDLVMANLPREYALTGPVPQSVYVRISGPRAVISSVDEGKLSFTLDLSFIQEGTSAFEVLPSKLGLPRGVEVTELSPSRIVLQTERLKRPRPPGGG